MSWYLVLIQSKLSQVQISGEEDTILWIPSGNGRFSCMATWDKVRTKKKKNKKTKKTKQKESTNKLLVFVQADLVHRSYSQACIYKLAGHEEQNYNKRKASKMGLHGRPFFYIAPLLKGYGRRCLIVRHIGSCDDK